MIEITGVRQSPSKESFMVYGQLGLATRAVDVPVKDVAEAIGSDPAAYDLADVVPSIVTLAFPKLVESFK